MLSERNQKRSERGYSVIELPAAIFLIFVILVFPLLDLAAIGLRYTFVCVAAYEAACSAAIAPTFQQNSGSNLSAQNAAAATAQKVASSFSGINLQLVDTFITVTNLQSGQTTRQDTKLATAADTTTNMYMIEPEIVAQVMPLVQLNLGGANVPGLTAPIPVTIRTRRVAQNPQGLNQ